MAIDSDSHKRQALLEDIRFLHAAGISPDKWPARVDRTPAAIQQVLRRNGETSLANLLDMEKKGKRWPMIGNANFAAHAMSDEHVDMLRAFWNAIDRVRRETGQRVTLPCESDPDMWFSFDVTEQAHAALACLECPVIAECKLLADAPPSPREGIWGGHDYSRRETARLCMECGKGWWPLGREGRARRLRLNCPDCYDDSGKRKT